MYKIIQTYGFLYFILEPLHDISHTFPLIKYNLVVLKMIREVLAVVVTTIEICFRIKINTQILTLRYDFISPISQLIIIKVVSCNVIWVYNIIRSKDVVFGTKYIYHQMGVSYEHVLGL